MFRSSLAAVCALGVMPPSAARAQSATNGAASYLTAVSPVENDGLASDVVAALPSAVGEPSPPLIGEVRDGAQAVPDFRSKRRVNAGWDGVAVRTGDGRYSLDISGQLKTDGRQVAGQSTLDEPLSLRYARVTASGTIAGRINYRISPAYSDSYFLNDAFLDVPVSPALQFRIGRYKPEVAHELNEPDGGTLFVERGFPTALLPSYDTGVQVAGDAASGRTRYALGLFRGVVDGAPRWSDTSALRTGGPVVTGRFLVRPFAASAVPLVAGLELGVGLTASRDGGRALPSFKTSVQDRFFRYNDDVIADGVHTRVIPQLTYDYNSVGGFAEFARSRQEIASPLVHTTVTNQAWQIVGYANLTGEHGSRVRPEHPFDPAAHRWGALQVAARYGALKVDDDLFRLALAAPGAAQQARQTTVGFVWYLTDRSKVRVNYERTAFDGGPRLVQSAFLYRFQVDY